MRAQLAPDSDTGGAGDSREQVSTGRLGPRPGAAPMCPFFG